MNRSLEWHDDDWSAPYYPFTAALALLLALIVVWPRKSFVIALVSNPVGTASGLLEMASFKLSSLARGGFGSMQQLDWDNIPSNDESSDFDFVASSSSASSSSQGARRLSVSAGNGLYYPGLLNAAGNLCFLNATLQSMASQPSLVNYLAQLMHDAELLDMMLPVTRTLLQTLNALNTPTRSPRPLRPVELATALAKSSKTRMQLLRSSEQQDAHELWIMIHEAVQEEADRLRAATTKASESAGLADILSLPSRMVVRSSSEKRKKKRHMQWADPYMLLTSQSIKCMICGYTRDVRHVAEDQLVLPVPFTSGCSLLQLLAEYTKPELISEYACRACCVRATQSKLHAQLDRLSGSSSQSSSNHANPDDSGVVVMTSSRKDRRRKVAKLVEAIDRVVNARDFERDFSSPHSSSSSTSTAPTNGDVLSAIKLERVVGAASKQVRLARAGSILTIHLNRSTHMGLGMGAGGAYKNSATVVFPEYLDLSPFGSDVGPSVRQVVAKDKDNGFTRVVGRSAKGKGRAASVDQFDQDDDDLTSERTIDQSKQTYRLASLVVHYGSHSFGHYVAFRRAPSSSRASDDTHASIDGGGGASGRDSDRWFRISDETVDECSIDTVLGSNPFLLFYERVRAHASPHVIDCDGVDARTPSTGQVVSREPVQRWQIG